MENGTTIVVKLNVTFANGNQKSFHMYEPEALVAQDEFTVFGFIKAQHFRTGDTPSGIYKVSGEYTTIIKTSEVVMVSIVQLSKPLCLFKDTNFQITEDGQVCDVICTRSTAEQFRLI
tara:strand:+ start:1859 stop:2212 length:354 start_codon:yes stop_codon:yes gene_type:complete